MRAGAAPRRRSTAVVDLRRAVPVVAAIAVLAGLVPSATANAITGIRNDIPTERLVAFDRCPDLGSGWQPQGSSRLGDARRLGALPTTRCRYSSTAVPPAATVAVDLSDPVLISEMASFPFEAEYRTIGTSAALEFQEPLPGAASATILSFDSASRPLTTVALTATLAGGSIPHAYARRLAVIVTDDPRPGSPLPAVAPHLSSALLARLSNVVRISPGQARRSTPYPKNGALACQLAEALVAHWTAP
jgi:hypothetical protein